MALDGYPRTEFLIFVVFFGATLLISQIKGSTRLWFRSVIPAWRFFDTKEETPFLWIREQDGIEDPQDWHRVETAFRLRWYHFFLNPNGNSIYANQSLLKLYLSDPTDEQVFRALDAAANQLGRQLKGSELNFEFKVTLNDEREERE